MAQARLSLPVGKAARTRVRLQVSVLVSVFWLVLGMFIMVAFEGATYCCSIFPTDTCLYTLSLRLLLDAGKLVPKIAMLSAKSIFEIAQPVFQSVGRSLLGFSVRFQTPVAETRTEIMGPPWARVMDMHLFLKSTFATFLHKQILRNM